LSNNRKVKRLRGGKDEVVRQQQPCLDNPAAIEEVRRILLEPCAGME